MNQLKLPYTTFQQAQQTLANITPADYFLAKELSHALCVNHDITVDQQSLIFHLLVELSQCLQAGNTCLPISALSHCRVAYECDDDGVTIKQGFQFSAFSDLECLLNQLNLSASSNNLLVYFNQHLYLRRYFVFEHELSLQIKARQQMCDEFSPSTIKQVVTQLFPKDETSAREDIIEEHSNSASPLDIDWQKVAVANALNKNFSVIAGGPGTGKTYTVTKLLAALVMLKKQSLTPEQFQQQKYALIAPTGKAAQRLSESLKNSIGKFKGKISDDILQAIPTSSQTIHRLLGFLPHSPNFRHNENNLLAVDFLLIDEVSMVDLALLTRLFRALPDHTKVVLLGDADQLPSVAIGNVLADIAPRPHFGFSVENKKYLQQVTSYVLTKAKQQPTDYLTFLYKSRRFSGDGGIGLLAKAVIAGQAQESWQLLTEQNKIENSELCLQIYRNKTINTVLHQAIEQAYLPIFDCEHVSEGFALLSQFRILSATRQGLSGVEAINDIVRSYLIDQGKVNKQQTLYHGLPIMITENHHKLNLFNGDVGLIWRQPNGHLMACFEDTEQGIKTVLPSRLPSFEPVYAMTIHKTQGSEFNHVLMLLPENSDNKILSRELLYTGITRAKNNLTILSYQGVWLQGVERQVTRFSQLLQDAHFISTEE